MSALPVSIHARARRATDEGPPPSLQNEGFNPRTRKACDCLSRVPEKGSALQALSEAIGSVLKKI
jgi:hypothetical protein